MGSEGLELEDWDADFLNQLIHAEEVALSSATQERHLPPPPPPAADFSFSPPRELSQRTLLAHIPNTSLKDDEIVRLKEELARVSSHVIHLNQECAELRKERDHKEEQLQSAYSRSGVNDAEHGGRDEKLSDPQTFSKHQDVNNTRERDGFIIEDGILACKSAGVQTDNYEPDNSKVKSYHDISHVSSKLSSVWYPSDLQVAQNMVSKILFSCEADIQVLLASADPNLQHKEKDSALVEPMVASEDPLQFDSSVAAAKILHFHSTLTRFSEGLVKVGDLLEALVALCRLKSVSIISRSLHILHTLLKFSVSLRRNYERRDDVAIGTSSSDNVVDELKSSVAGRTIYANGNMITDQSCNLDWEPFGAEVSRQKYYFDCSSLVSFDQINWISLLQLMCQIASIYREEYVREEAVSIMNIIVMRSNPYTDREKFLSEKLFQSISELLRKEAGLGVQTQAVHLLYLLLNCPKIMSWFCTTCREEVERAGKLSVDNNGISASQGCHMIFKGLADCTSCSGLGSQELRLRRNAIVLLVFLASSGTCGFEIMFGPSTAKKFHLLPIIVCGLASDIDLEAKESVQSPEIFKERTLLMRETLILLNGLVSHPQYCGPVLRALTSQRDVVCLTIGIANRLTTKAKCLWKDDNITTEIREVEVLELARVFKKRIFTFLGNSIS